MTGLPHAERKVFPAWWQEHGTKKRRGAGAVPDDEVEARLLHAGSGSPNGTMWAGDRRARGVEETRMPAAIKWGAVATGSYSKSRGRQDHGASLSHRVLLFPDLPLSA
jgi:hypothetical protein